MNSNYSLMKRFRNLFKVIFVISFFIGLAVPSFLSAQDISGTWHGKLTLPAGSSLTIVFHINRADQGGYITTLDSPDQGAKNIKTASTSFQDSVLVVQIPGINANYKGKLNSAANTFMGTFMQGMPLPLSLVKGEPSLPGRPQEPQPPFPYKSEEVSVRNEQDGITLAGTLTLPEKGNRFPAVVLVTGSGAQDRNEEIHGHKPFLLIADYLTRHGIAVLRCDDRGTAASQGDHASATNEDFATDTEAMLNYLRGRKEINAKKIGIIGHSCGGTIAFITAAKDSDVAFIVSLAGVAVRGDSLLVTQTGANFKSKGMPDAVWQTMKPAFQHQYSTVLRQTDKSVDEIREELYANATQPMSPEQLKDLNVVKQITAQINSITTPWFLHLVRYDPKEDLKKIKCPVLALNGEKDIQVDATINLTAIQQRITENGNKNVTIKAYPQLNHLFQTCQQGTLEEYRQLEETMSPEVLKDMTEWILEQNNKNHGYR